MAALAGWARRHGCSRINFTVAHDDKPARRFYQRLGSLDLTADGWHLQRLTGDALHRLAELERPDTEQP